MARSAAVPESGPEREKVKVPFVYRGRVESGAKVYVHYGLQGERWQFAELSPSRDGGLACDVEMPEGIGFEYKFCIAVPGQPTRWDPPGGPETNMQGLARNAETAGTASTAAGPSKPDQLRAYLKPKIQAILDSARTKGTFENLPALVEALEADIEARGMNRVAAVDILAVVAGIIKEKPDVPVALKKKFEGNPPRDFAEFKQRIEEGSRLFRRQVFLSLRADENARKALGLKPNDTTFRDQSMAELAGRVCNEFDFRDAMPAIKMGLENIPNVPGANPELARRRLALLQERILPRLSPEQASGVKDFVSGIPADKQTQLLEMAVQAGGMGALLLGAPGLAVSGWLAKGTVEGISGVSMADVTKAFKNPTTKSALRELWDVFKQNNLVTKWLHSNQGLTALIGERMKAFAKKTIPFVGPFRFSGAAGQQPEEVTFGQEGATGEAMKVSPKKAEDFIRQACKSACTQ